MKQAFTLAEVLITLSIIGIITAVIIPVAMHSKPDENVMKFKKAHNTLYQVVSKLINSDRYYLDGDLGVKINGDLIDGTHTGDKTYLCETMADILSTKSKHCSEYMGLSKIDYHILISKNWPEGSLWMVENTCKEAASHVGEEIKTTDGIVFYQAAPGFTYHTVGYQYNYRDSNNNVQLGDFPTVSPLYVVNESKMYNASKIICIDIDGIPSNGSKDCDDIKDICPFAYGIRWDGEIVSGIRSQQWLNKSLQGEN